MLNFDSSNIQAIFTAFIADWEAQNPMTVNTDVLVDQLIISRIIKNFKRTVKWFVPKDGSKISFLVNEMFATKDTQAPLPALGKFYPTPHLTHIVKCGVFAAFCRIYLQNISEKCNFKYYLFLTFVMRQPEGGKFRLPY